jgi:predicted RNA-binding protein
MLKADKEEMLLENVELLEVEGDEVIISNIFGEEIVLRARIKRYDGSENRILLEAIE